MSTHIKLTILGNLPRKSNSRIWTGRRLIKSKKALEYVDECIWQMKAGAKLWQDENWHSSRAWYSLPMLGYVKLTATIYYFSQLSDLSDELLCDCLQKSGIIENDRQIVEKHLYRRTDRFNPRVELELEEMEAVK